MKLLLLITTLLLSSSIYASNNRTVSGWNPSIPSTPKKVLAVIEAEAEYFSFETDSTICGGEVSHSQVVAYNSFVTEDGNEVHEMTIEFQVSKAENYCQSESLLSCQVPMQVLSTDGIVMGEWNCVD